MLRQGLGVAGSTRTSSAARSIGPSADPWDRPKCPFLNLQRSPVVGRSSRKCPPSRFDSLSDSIGKTVVERVGQLEKWTLEGPFEGRLHDMTVHSRFSAGREALFLTVTHCGRACGVHRSTWRGSCEGDYSRCLMAGMPRKWPHFHVWSASHQALGAVIRHEMGFGDKVQSGM